MRSRTVLVGLVLLMILFFAGINWQQFTEPTELSVLLTSIEAPIGVIMLGTVGALSLLYVLFLGSAEGAALIESSRLRKELEKARRLADSAETSRFDELQRDLARRFEAMEDDLAELGKQNKERSLSETIEQEGNEVIERVEEAEAELKKTIKQSK